METELFRKVNDVPSYKKGKVQAIVLPDSVMLREV